MSESQQCRALFDWVQLHERMYPELRWLHHIPNGGNRDKRVGAKLKAEGVRPGILDYFLPVKRGEFSGLYIEMKSPNPRGRMTVEQYDFAEFVTAQNFAVVVCWEWSPARWYLMNYIDGVFPLGDYPHGKRFDQVDPKTRR